MLDSRRPDIGKGGFLESLDRYPVTFGLLGANLVLFVFAMYRGGQFQIPVEIQMQLGANAYPYTLHEPWRLLTSAFLHYGPIHFLFNSFALFYLGRILEVHYGWARMLTLYVGFALVASLASLSWYAIRASGAISFLPTTVAASAGASGAIFGLILLGYMYARSAPGRLRTLGDNLRVWIVIGVVFSLLFPGIDVANHTGGAIAGALAGTKILPKPGEDVHPAWTWGALLLALVCLGCFGAAVWTMRQGSL